MAGPEQTGAMHAARATIAPFGPRLAAVAAALGLLWLAGAWMLAAPAWALAALVGLVALPIWAARSEAVQMHRRALLDGLLARETRLHRWLWPGHLVAAAEAVVAALTAVLLIAVAAGLSELHWAVLAADAVLLAILAGPVERRAARVAREGRAGALARRWPLAIGNAALLGTALFVIDYAVLGAPDTRGLAWNTVAQQAFATGAGAETLLARTAVGAVAMADALSWHVAQTVIPTLPEGTMRAVSWALVLGGAGLFAVLASRLLIGALALVSPAETPRRAGAGAAAGLALAVLLIGQAAHEADTGARPLALRAAGLLDPCGGGPGAEDLGARLDQRLAEAEAATLAALETRIDALDGRFAAEADRAIEAYLDWHFSVIGEYQRLGALAGGTLAEAVADRLAPALLAGDAAAETLKATGARLATEADLMMSAGAGDAAQMIADRIAAAPCLGADLAAVVPDSLAPTLATPVPEGAVAGAAVAIATPALLRGGGVAVRTVARRLLGPAGLRLLRPVARTAVKRGGSALASAGGAAAICAPGGPVALVCGLGAGIVAWLSVDVIAVEIAEARFRDDLRRDLQARAAGRRAEVIARLAETARARVAALTRHYATAGAAIFVPLRDG